MINIIKQEIPFEKTLKQKLEFICQFTKVKPTFINGSIRKIDKSNLNYVEPHRIIIKNITFLAFNYSTDIYIKNLKNKIKLSELEDYINKSSNTPLPRQWTFYDKCCIINIDGNLVIKSLTMKFREVKVLFIVVPFTSLF